MPSRTPQQELLPPRQFEVALGDAQVVFDLLGDVLVERPADDQCHRGEHDQPEQDRGADQRDARSDPRDQPLTRLASRSRTA